MLSYNVQEGRVKTDEEGESTQALESLSKMDQGQEADSKPDQEAGEDRYRDKNDARTPELRS